MQAVLLPGLWLLLRLVPALQKGDVPGYSSFGKCALLPLEAV